jgi:hypothetical protein
MVAEEPEDFVSQVDNVGTISRDAMNVCRPYLTSATDVGGVRLWTS